MTGYYKNLISKLYENLIHLDTELKYDYMIKWNQGVDKGGWNLIWQRLSFSFWVSLKQILIKYPVIDNSIQYLH